MLLIDFSLQNDRFLQRINVYDSSNYAKYPPSNRSSRHRINDVTMKGIYVALRTSI